jgi:hypothetical protein
VNYSKMKSINGKKEYDMEGEYGLHGRKCRDWKEEYKLEGGVYEWEGRVLILRKNKIGKEGSERLRRDRNVTSYWLCIEGKEEVGGAGRKVGGKEKEEGGGRGEGGAAPLAARQKDG